MPLALFGITDDTLNLAISLVLLLVVVLWLSLVYWTWADARRRIGDPVLVTTAVVASFIAPFIGTIIYTILRPPEFLEDVREREIETQASELRMRHLTAQSCPRCEHPIERTWLRCPQCEQRLKDPCRSCNRPVDPRWSVCPYCETPMRSSQSAGESRRGRSRSSSTPSRGADPARAERDSTEGSGGGARRAATSTASSERPSRTERAPAPPADADGPSARPPLRRSTTTS